MSTMQDKVNAILTEFGLTITVDHFKKGRKRAVALSVDAPYGKHFAAIDAHELYHETEEHQTVRDTWADMLDSLKHGLDDCDLKECLFCRDNAPEFTEEIA